MHAIKYGMAVQKINNYNKNSEMPKKCQKWQSDSTYECPHPAITVCRWPDADEGRKRHCCTRSQQRQPSWIWTWTKKENNVICGDLSALLEVLIFSRIWNAFNIKLVENLRIQPKWRRMDGWMDSSLGQHKKSSQQNRTELNWNTG